MKNGRCLGLRGWGTVAVCCVAAAVARADYKDDIGYRAFTNSLAQLSIAVPTGDGITASQVEGYYAEVYRFVPDTNNVELAGKTVTVMTSGTALTSDHATRVGRALYGTASVAPDVDNIHSYYSTDWINSFLRYGQSRAPLVESRSIQNHSWILTNQTEAVRTEIIRRYDFQIQRDQTIAVVGLNNGSGTEVPDFGGHSYNAIVVGLTNGNHSRDGTVGDVAGRIKPDIVASPYPFQATSYSTPVVGAAAALLLEMAQNDSELNRATNAVAIKSMLMAGATKTNLTSWSQTASQPIDEVFGAGALNINNSGLILVEGRQEASTNSTVAVRGWDFDTALTNQLRFYYFDVEADKKLEEFSASLNWNRNIQTSQVGQNWSITGATVADMALGLYEVGAGGFDLGDLIWSSDSAVDNVEYVYQTELQSGRYALQVSGGDSTDYALSWTGVLVPEPGVAVLILFGGFLCAWARRRQHL
ncbi:MAG: PEP-CTERM sorting domain-containing protein [Candidatus Marinimicrobia bacterium]|nr:PEP-CTERM sorting domain-containing protein [Candidatus Neomarinimicrobiota bacterium]